MNDQNASMPFPLGQEGDAKTTRLLNELLAVCQSQAEAAFAGRQVQPAAVPEANLIHRTALSMAVQGLIQVSMGKPLDYHPFNVMDGIAHGIGAMLAVAPPLEGDETAKFVANQVRGYMERTRPVAQQQFRGT